MLEVLEDVVFPNDVKGIEVDEDELTLTDVDVPGSNDEELIVPVSITDEEEEDVVLMELVKDEDSRLVDIEELDVPVVADEDAVLDRVDVGPVVEEEDVLNTPDVVDKLEKLEVTLLDEEVLVLVVELGKIVELVLVGK